LLTGDASLRTRPMERVATPLRAMGATIETLDGCAPVRIDGGSLRGSRYEASVPTAQVKSAVLLAGLDADGETMVVEPEPTRDHTERALRALGGPVALDGSTITVSRFQHEGFEGAVPGDPSSAAFVVAAAALTGSEVTIEGVGLNPTRLHFLDVMARMGVHTERRIERAELGEPVGDIWVAPCHGLRPVRVEASEVASVIDEIPILAMLAQHADGDSWFLGVAELTVKESDRLAAIVDAILDLGGHAGAEGADLIVAGGGLDGGAGRSGGDHRMAMALVVAAFRARGPVEIDGVESADVSFPGFVPTMNTLGASIEVVT
jgi:3-phosphoshikimate 1-carboxyvinyltransferase